MTVCIALAPIRVHGRYLPPPGERHISSVTFESRPSCLTDLSFAPPNLVVDLEEYTASHILRRRVAGKKSRDFTVMNVGYKVLAAVMVP